MKIKSASKSRSANEPKKSKESIFEMDPKKAVSPIDLLDVDVITEPKSEQGNDASSLNLSISSLNEKLVSEGFDSIEIVFEDKQERKLPKKATAKEIEKIFSKQSSEEKIGEEKKVRMDLTSNIDKKKLAKLIEDDNDEDSEDEIEVKFVKSSNMELPKATIANEKVSAVTGQTDRAGILEVRLGKNNETFADQKIDEISSRLSDLNTGLQIDRPNLDRSEFNVKRGMPEPDLDVPKKSELLKVLESKDTNSGNKRRPNLLKRSEILNAVSGKQKNLQKPLIKAIERKPARKIKTEVKKIDLPGPNSRVSIKITNRKTGRTYRKPIRPRRIKTIPYRTVLPFKSDLELPKIDVASDSNSQAIVRVSNVHPRINELKIYRREISSRTFEDQYDLINTVEDPPDSFVFIDNLENARAYKYVCVADDLPVYSWRIFRNRGYKYENVQEPFVYAYQNGFFVRIMVERLPSFCKKLFVFRKSSADDMETLVDSVSLYGRGSRNIRLIDRPPPIEQVITYRFVWIDENGIENTFEEKPQVIYTAKLGDEEANIIRFSAKYNEETSEVDITGQAQVDNIFIANNDSELKNPTENTLLAAARGQSIVKIQLRRINLKTEDDEIILKEIINPGLSKFKTELLSLNRLKFSFSDSGENALTFGYTPTFNNTRYAYIARIIVYPLGLELRRVSDFEKIDGIVAPGRLKYQFDPAVFDHPLNTELGILPSVADVKSYLQADIVGQTSRSFHRSVKVVDSDVDDAVSLEASVEIDAAFDPVVLLRGEIPEGLVDDIDHVAIELSYDTVKRRDIIDRVFMTDGTFEYYDYAFDDLACEKVNYSLIGIGKDFRKLFRSDPASISLNDPKIKLANNRKKSMQNYARMKHIQKLKARKRLEPPILRKPGRRDG